VYRADLGAFQVTYAGHPLYLFDPGPGSFAGEDFFETVGPFLFPWETGLVSRLPQRTVQPGPGQSLGRHPAAGCRLHEQRAGHQDVSRLPPLPKGIPVTVYTFSADTPWQSHCYGACAREFIPVTTEGAPTGVDTGAVGVIPRWDGLRQVTYNGHPLYIYNQEQPLRSAPATARR